MARRLVRGLIAEYVGGDLKENSDITVTSRTSAGWRSAGGLPVRHDQHAWELSGLVWGKLLLLHTTPEQPLAQDHDACAHEHGDAWPIERESDG